MREEYEFSKGVRGKYAGRVRMPGEIVEFRRVWRNPSVRRLAGDGDPIEVIREKARGLVLDALDKGLLSLPIDPIKLAESRSIRVIPRQDVREARTVSTADQEHVIEYNPNRPKARVRFSICHEIAHTLFPDCAEQVRYRGFHDRSSESTHELEMLCNIAAAEFLLPIGSMQADLENLNLTIDTILSLRAKYEASTEAVLLRVLAVAPFECAVFAATAEESDPSGAIRYRLEYVKGTPGWSPGLGRGDLLPAESIVRECTALGATAKSSDEEWVPGRGKLRIEVVGTTPYPEEQRLPRVLGIVMPVERVARSEPWFEILRGDALQPRGTGRRIVAHVVNDQTANWGAGFGRAVQSKWPNAQRHFKSILEGARGSKLGITAFSQVEEEVFTFQMVCQRGYGPSPTPRLRYEALRKCLFQLSLVAIEEGASVHMPKIGTGEAGGSWGLISNLITEELCAKGVSVVVYETTKGAPSQKPQPGLFDK